MAKILGLPMIGHVYNNVRKNKKLDKVIVATCDTEIYEFINNIGGESVMTSNTHDRASDRCSEALLKIEKKDSIQYDIVVMVQGDEPMIDQKMITEAVEPLIHDDNILVSNLVGKIKDLEEFNDPNCIKVVCDLNGYAMYFSRMPIPTFKNQKIFHFANKFVSSPLKETFY